MELDPDWYAYQCKSGEVLFYYHAVTGEHRWAIHFCSCFKSKLSSSTAEPCCIWEPVKSQTCESGKFVRSIGTETEDQYFTAIQRNEEIIESPRAEITFEYSVSKDRLNEDGTTENSCTNSTEKPVEVFLEDPFVPSGDNQNSSKRITLKLKEISSQEFSLADSINPRKVPRRVDDISFPRKSPAITKASCGTPTASAKDKVVLEGANSSGRASFVRQERMQPLSLDKEHSLGSSSSVGVLSSSFDESNSGGSPLESLHAKRQRGSASSRKNPEPRKLLKRSNSIDNEQISTEWNDDEGQEYYDEELRETRGFDGTEEHSLSEDPVVLIGEPSSSSPTSTLTKQEDFKDEADDQPSVCQLCGKECATPAMLTNHLMKHQPSGTSCPICNKYFSRRQGLRYHVQTHAGDKPHICKICNKTFTKSASLVAHYRTHSGIRPFKCPKCNKGFTHSSNLSSHLRIHSSLRPYRCNFCSKGFKTSSHLTLHLRSHSDERPYECTECGKAFKNSSHLRSHEKLHLLPKTVFCNSCGEGFRSFSHLIYHQQTNPQCAEEDEQEVHDKRGTKTHSNSRSESKVKQSHMGETRTYQYSNDMKRHSEIERQGRKYGPVSNTAENSFQKEKEKRYHSTESLSNAVEHSSKWESQKTQQSASDALSNEVEHSPQRESWEKHQSTSDALSNVFEHLSQRESRQRHQSSSDTLSNADEHLLQRENHKNVRQSSSSTHEIEYKEQDGVELEGEPENPNLIEKQRKI